MPNWVMTKVIAKDYDKLKKALINENGEVDFNILIPMPENLNIECGTGSYDETDISKKTYDFLKRVYKANDTQQEFVDKAKEDELLVEQLKRWYREDKIENCLKGFYNKEKYGYVDWYEWCLDKWDTKWNAVDTVIHDVDKVIEFQTAWSLAHAVLVKVAQETDIRVLYADEDIGRNCGMIELRKDEQGRVVERELLGEGDFIAHYAWDGDETVFHDEDWEELEQDNAKYKEYEKFCEKINEVWMSEM